MPMKEYADEEDARHRMGGTDEDVAQPQGQALILELQRLRQAFELDNRQDQRAPLRRPANDEGRPGARRPRQAKPKRSKKKGKMGRVLDWLGPFGSQSEVLDPEPPAPRRGRSAREPQFMSPPPADGMRVPAGHAWPNERQARGPSHRARRSVADEHAEVAAGGSVDRRPAADAARRGAAIGAAEPGGPDTARSFGDGRRPQWPDRRGRHSSPIATDRRTVAAAPGESIVLRAARAYEGELRTGLRALLVVGGVAGGWMTLVPLSGAVVVPGNLVVQSNVKTIQHPTGGVVAQIPVHNGMRVNAGDLLLRLDSTQAQASLQVVSKQLDEVRAKSARLVAERDGLPRPAIPPEMSSRLDDNNVKTLLASEASLFRARTTARESQKELLKSKVSQLGEEIVGLEAQVASKAKQLELITGELTGVQELFDKRLVPIARLTALQRESARIEGERGQLISTIAETKTKVDEAKLQTGQARPGCTHRSRQGSRRGAGQGSRTQRTKRRGARRARAHRDARAGVGRDPSAERAHHRRRDSRRRRRHGGGAGFRRSADRSQVAAERHRPGAEGPAGLCPLLGLQPAGDAAADRSGVVCLARHHADQQSGTSYFTVRIMLPEEERRRLAGLQLSSGMPAEVFMQTGSRTMLSYLFKPIMDQFQRAFVER